MTTDYQRIPFGAIRETVDPPFEADMAALDEAYYGVMGEDGRRVPGTGWRNGESRPWKGFDKQNTPADSAALFYDLQLELHTQHALTLWEAVFAAQETLSPGERSLLPKILEEGQTEPPELTNARAELAAIPADVRARVAAALQKGADRRAWTAEQRKKDKG
jgi:hypothetical protein